MQVRLLSGAPNLLYKERKALPNKSALKELLHTKELGSEYSKKSSYYEESQDIYKDMAKDDNTHVKSVDDGISVGKWAVSNGGKVWSEGSPSASEITPGLYSTHMGMQGPYLVKRLLSTDDLVELPDDATSDVLAHIDDFNARRPKYEEFGFVFKRGILLYGPQGSGKSSTIYRLIKKYTEADGVVFLCDYPSDCEANIEVLRHLEPNRPLLVVMEDVDDLVAYYGDRTLTKLLDGGDNVHNVVFVATTNYPERLPPRLLRRPSRFDKVQYIGMPSDAARKAYLEATVPNITPTELANYVRETELLSIAQIKEVILLTFVYGIPLAEAVDKVVNLGKNLIYNPEF